MGALFSLPRFALLPLAGLVGSVFVGACGGTPPPPPAAPAAKPIATTPPPPPDLSEVPEPPGLVAIGRVANVQRMVKAVGGWAQVPLPESRELLKSILDSDVADVVDLQKPVDGAVTVELSMRGPNVLAAFAVPVSSVDAAKAKLESGGHRIVARPGGQWLVEGSFAGKKSSAKRRPARGADDEEPEERVACVLSPGVGGARLVCGERDALDGLVPYLTRTAPRKTYPADIHVELRPTPVREPLVAFRGTLPVIARSAMGGSTPAIRDIIDAATGELVDLVTDIDRLTVDATVTDAGVELTSRVDHGKTTSTIAQLAVAHPERAEAPPPAFWHLPADTEIAAFGRGSDPKLFERPRQLVGALVADALGPTEMPEPERNAVRDLFADRMLPLFVGALVYGKGTDEAALVRAADARAALPARDTAASLDADQKLAAQAVGWHLVQVAEPITKVAPVLREWQAVWARPGFTKWAKGVVGGKNPPQVKPAALPAGVTLPKDAVHVELTIPRRDVVDLDALRAAPATPGGKTGKTPPKPRMLPRKPLVVHVLAVPDAGSTWLGIGLDAKLVAQHAAMALSSAPDKDTLAKVPAFEGLREVKANALVALTPRGLLSAGLGAGTSRMSSAYAAMPNKGATVIPIATRAEAPGQSAPAGSAVTTMKLPKGALEDLVRFFLSSG